MENNSPGKWKGESLNIVSAFEALGKNLVIIEPEDFKGVIKRTPTCPGAGAVAECTNTYVIYY
jgi:dihydroxy-acid dehydratase